MYGGEEFQIWLLPGECVFHKAAGMSSLSLLGLLSLQEKIIRSHFLCSAGMFSILDLYVAHTSYSIKIEVELSGKSWKDTKHRAALGRQRRRGKVPRYS